MTQYFTNLIELIMHVINREANPEAREPAPLLISEGGIAWRGEANEMRCGEAFDVKFELGPAVTWAGSTADTSWTNGAYVELWKVSFFP